MMACTTTQQQRRLRLIRPPRGSSSFVLAAPTLLLVLLLLAVFALPSSCRPLPLGVVKAAADVILLPLPSVPREEEDHQLAGSRHQWLLNKKPRGKPPPSAPSKRTN
jgi:hypothetical protein